MKNKIQPDTTSLKAVRRELRRAKLADIVAVQMALKFFWRPLTVWRAVVFVFKNRKRQRILATMSRANMSFKWRCALPLKKQRQLGLLPKL